MAQLKPASVGDTAPPVSYFVDWESKNEDGSPIDEASRKVVFEKWCIRMLHKSCGRDEVAATEWVTRAVVPNEITSCYQFVEAARDPKEWVFKDKNDKDVLIRPTDRSYISQLTGLCRVELKVLTTSGDRVANEMSDSQGSLQTSAMLAMIASGTPGGG
jgi:hypothetical protein